MNWKFLVYDWGGWNVALFHAINASTPSGLTPAVKFFSLAGNYWTAPVVVLILWWYSTVVADGHCAVMIRKRLVEFIAAFGLAIIATTVLKLGFDFPRPPAVLGHLVRVIGQAERHYSLPSGHATYAALVAGALWPLVQTRLRLGLMLYLLLVGWSRIAAGMHFPADVLAGWGLGFVCLAGAHPVRLAISAIASRIASDAVLRWYGLAVMVTVADQAAKFAIAHTFAYGEQLSITPLFNLVYVLNPGAAFSMLADAAGWQRYFFIVLALCISIWLSHMLRQTLPSLEAWGYGLILGGALGNVVDRILRGKVVDFLDFHWQGAHWPSFNLADVSIALGAICLIIAVVPSKSPARASTE